MSKEKYQKAGKLIAPHAWSMAGWPSETQSTKPDAVEVWGYADTFAYNPGDAVKLHVSCTRPTYSMKIIRDGRHPETVLTRDGIAGQRHAVPEESYAHGCDWPVALEIPIPHNWRPGFYLVVFTVEAPHDRFES